MLRKITQIKGKELDGAVILDRLVKDVLCGIGIIPIIQREKLSFKDSWDSKNSYQGPCNVIKGPN